MNHPVVISTHRRAIALRTALFLAAALLLSAVFISMNGSTPVLAQSGAIRGEADPVPTATDLFVPAPVSDAVADAMLTTEVNQQVGVLRARSAGVNFSQLNAAAADYAADRAFTADTFRLNLFADVGFDVVNTGLWDRSLNEPGYIWVGRVAGQEIGDVVLVVTPDQIEGRVYVPGTIYGITKVGSVYSITEIDPEIAIGMAAQPVTAQINSANAIEGLGNPQIAPQATAPDPAAMTDDGSQIDVMVAYNATTLSAGESVASWLAALDAEFAAVNLGYQNSGVVQRVRLVHAVQVSYTDAGDLGTDLERLTSPSDGYMDNVHTLRDQYAADLVAFVPGSAAAGACGIAWLMPSYSVGNPSYFEANGFSVTPRECFFQYSFAHELGHNMGSQHDFANAGSQGAFSYGYGHQNVGNFRTIMAYNNGCNCPRIPRWSNPNQTYNGAPLGTSSANNALSLNNTRNTVANFRQGTVPAPVITAPSGTISNGFGNPSYTWTVIPNTTAYELAVNKPDGLTLFTLPNISAATYCGQTTCTIDPITMLGEAARLPVNGTYNAYIRGAGVNWSGAYPFTLNASPPAGVTLGSPTNTNTLRPTFTFTLSGTAQNSTAFDIFINQKSLHDAGNYSSPAVDMTYTRTQLCSSPTGTSCTFTPSVNLADFTTYYFWVLSMGPGGATNWVSQEFRVETIPTPVLSAPTGTITNGYGDPSYTWNKINGAASYELAVSKPDGTTLFNLTGISAATYCATSTCTIQPINVLGEAARLTGNGTFKAYIRVTAAGWSVAYPFTLNAAPPALPTIGTPTNTDTYRPTIPFTLSGNAQNATWFNVYINPVVNTWFTRAQLCGSVSSNTCSYTLSTNLTNNTTYTFWIRAYGPGGYSTGGTSGWASQAFTVQLPAPPVLSAPTGTITNGYGNPTYTWNTVAGATTYELAVARSDGSTLFNLTNISAVTYCGGGTCNVQPIDLLGEVARLPSNGLYRAYVRAAGGLWSGAYAFTLNAAPPVIPTIGSVTNTNTLRPTINFTLNGTAANSTYFQVTLSPLPATWYKRDQLCGTVTSTTCSYTPPSNLANGMTYTLWLRGYGPGGYSTGGTSGYIGTTFTINTSGDVSQPSVVPGVNASFDSGNVIVTWSAVNAAAGYTVWLGAPGGAATYTTQTLTPDALGCPAASQTCTFTSATAALGLASGTSLSVGVQTVGAAGAVTTGGTYNTGYVIVGPYTVP